MAANLNYLNRRYLSEDICPPFEDVPLGLFRNLRCGSEFNYNGSQSLALQNKLTELFRTLFTAYKEEAIRGETQKAYELYYKINYVFALIDYLSLLKLDFNLVNDCTEETLSTLLTNYNYDCVKETAACKYKIDVDELRILYGVTIDSGIGNMTILYETEVCNPFTIHS